MKKPIANRFHKLAQRYMSLSVCFFTLKTICEKQQLSGTNPDQEAAVNFRSFPAFDGKN